eukprot:TRINITY_DN4552_c0_g1_i1.p2 TRINITY_DN4552_c0_g1~~TRINITY_DN4552_c0_g1_i1.p2  ORF type:complete len:733 (+),score=129.12 TRINITY_DN4552_c0_g1_i1:2499-4697(+)
MHVYLHHDAENGSVTHRLDVGGAIVTVDQALVGFVNACHAKQPGLAIPAAEQLQLCTENGRLLQGSELLGEAVGNGDDLFVKAATVPQVTSVSPQPVAAPAAVPSVASEKQEKVTAQLSSAEKTQMDSIVRLVTASMEKRSYANAISILRSVIEGYPEIASMHALLGKCFTAIDKWSQALTSWQRACALEPTNLEYRVALAETYYSLGDFANAVAEYSNAADALGTAPLTDEQVDDFKIGLGRALYAKGETDSGIALFTNVLSQNEAHRGALLAYSRALCDRDKRQDALRVALNLLVRNPKDKQIRAHFTSLLLQFPTLAPLYEELQVTEAVVPALAFLAVVIKDHGAVEFSAELYRRSCALLPSNASYALNYAHTLEVLNKHSESIMAVVSFLQNNPLLRVSNVTCADVLSTLGPLDEPLHKATYRSGADAQKWAERRLVVRSRQGRVYWHSEDPAIEAPEVTSKPNATKYEADELDLLALFFTLVKNLFVCGTLSRIPALVVLIDPLRYGEELHLTTIRNEQAYFSSVAQLMEDWHPLPEVDHALYVCGDSHSLSPSWKVIQHKGRPTMLLNALVTGLKCWHLRPESRFYPKANFYNVVNAIPDHSEVLMIFGEIDCREGILVAVERGIYADIEEGMRFVIGIYMQVLDELHQRKDLTFYVHPVLPVLDPTRKLVKIFTRLLGAEVRRRDQPWMRWLPFFEDLLTADQEKLKPEYDLPLVESALRSVCGD